MAEKEVNVVDYLRVFYMHRYLVLLILVVCTSLGFLMYKYEVPVYSSTSHLVVDKETLDLGYTVEGVQRVDELVGSAQGYYSMRQVIQNLNLTQYPIKMTLMERLTSEYKEPIKYLDENELTHYYIENTQISKVESKTQTDFIRVTVKSQYPELASAIANEVGTLIIARSEKAKNSIVQRSIEYIDRQLSSIETAMQSSRRELEKVEISSSFRETEILVDRIERNKNFLSSYLVEKEHLTADLAVVKEGHYDEGEEDKEEEIEDRLAFIEERIDELTEEIETDEESLRTLDRTAFYRFQDLEFKTATNEQIYSTLLSEKQKLSLGLITITDRVRFLSRAATPLKPSTTNGLTFVLVAFVIGVGISFGVLQLLNAFHEGFKTNKDIEDAMGLKVLGNLPKISRKEKDKLINPKTDKTTTIEPYRTLATNLKFAIRGKNIKSIMFSSDKAKTGKSTTLTNLAAVMAESGKKVLLVDVDLRRPNLHKRLNTSRKPGLTDVLAGKVKLKDAIIKVRTNLFLLPSGSLEYNPQNIIESEGMKKLIHAFEKFYDFVFVDSIPLTSYSDVEILASITDASVLILDQRKSYKESMQQSRNKLKYVKSDILGIAVNRSEISSYEKYYKYDTEEE